MNRLLLLTPPLLQTNTPYPATMHLTGFLESQGADVHQRDLSIKVVRDILLEYGDETTDELLEFLGGPAPLEAKRAASEAIDALAIWIRDNVDAEFGFSRYAEEKCRAVEDFGLLEKLIRRRGAMDKPLERHLKAAMDEVKPTVVGVTCPFPGTLVGAFKIARYVRKHYPGVRLLLGGGYVSTELREMTDKRPYKYFDEFQYDEGYVYFVGQGKRGKANSGKPPLLTLTSDLGGSCKTSVTTWEGRALSRPRTGRSPSLPRTGRSPSLPRFCNYLLDLKSEIPPFVRPSYRGIDWDEYFDVVETDNFVTNLWNSGKWVKLVMARGCYWHKCAFCDVVLPYIGCFQMPKASEIVDAMESFGRGSCKISVSTWEGRALSRPRTGRSPSLPRTGRSPSLPQTGRSPSLPQFCNYLGRSEVVGQRSDNGICKFHCSTSNLQPPLRRFHFVDEAMPPALVRGVCEEIVRRGLKVEWWGNVRFDAAFTPALAKLMAKAGCIAVTGGLECANDRLLALMNKGITLASAEKVLKAFKAAKIFVHAYLMYDFPTETKAEQKGAEKYVRDLAKRGLIQSCFWHRFALTVHSPIAKDPEKFGIIVTTPPKAKKVFARNELTYKRIPIHHC